MLILNRHLLAAFARRHADAKAPLARWERAATAARWNSFAEVRLAFPSADMVAGHKLIFNIGGNKYRLVVQAVFIEGQLIITGVHTHAEYDKLNLR